MQVPTNLQQLVGREHSLDAVNRALHAFATREHPDAVGAYLISCSDESETEWLAAFHEDFVRRLLPELKFMSRAAFRSANLGARYEEGALQVAEDHYATPASGHGFKLVVIKVHSHVSVVDQAQGPVYGQMLRYDRESVYCGALHLLLMAARENVPALSALPFVEELRRTFSHDGLDRVALLNDPVVVDPALRSLFAAMVNTGLQRERIVEGIRAHDSATPTLYVIASSVTLNREHADSELCCGFTIVDERADPPAVDVFALGSDPRRWSARVESGRLRVEGA